MSPANRKTTGSPDSTNGKASMLQNGDINKLKHDFATNLFYVQGKTTRTATLHNYYLAVAHTVRDRMQHLFVNSVEALLEKQSRIVCYLSAEFLLGPHLGNNLINLGLYDEVAQATEEAGLDFQNGYYLNPMRGRPRRCVHYRQ